MGSVETLGMEVRGRGVASSVALQAANAALLSYRNTLVSAGAAKPSAGALVLSLFK